MKRIAETKTVNVSAQSESITIILPLPNKLLSPNFPVASRRMMFTKAAATKKYRRLTMRTIATECIETIPWEKVTLKASFYYKTNRKRDDDNAMSSLKAARDGIIDAGLVIDDNWIHMKQLPPTFAIDRSHPRVVLTITRITNDSN